MSGKGGFGFQIPVIRLAGIFCIMRDMGKVCENSRSGRYVVRIRPPLGPAAFGAPRGGFEQSGVETLRRHCRGDKGRG